LKGITSYQKGTPDTAGGSASGLTDRRRTCDIRPETRSPVKIYSTVPVSLPGTKMYSKTFVPVGGCHPFSFNEMSSYDRILAIYHWSNDK
jgi:hypothetical protein